MFLMLTVVSA